MVELQKNNASLTVKNQKMRKYLFLFVLLTTLSAGAQQVTYSINGISDNNGKKVYLTDRISWHHVDSAVVANGKFSLLGQAEKDALLVIEPQGDRRNIWQTLFFNDGTPITVNLNDSTLKGSPQNERLSTYKIALNSLDSQHDFPGTLKKLDEIFTNERETFIPAAFVVNYKKMFVRETFDSVMSQQAVFTSHPFVKDYLSKQKQLAQVVIKRDRSKDDERIAATKAFVGQQFTDLEMADVDGKTHKLSEYVGNGRWLFVDMWASWCGPCRAEMPNVVAAYEKYHEKGLDIVGLSLDSHKEAWVNAIEALKMPWVHLSDLKGWKSIVTDVYKVWSIPDNLLIDPQGKIVARGLREETLHNKLKEIFGE